MLSKAALLVAVEVCLTSPIHAHDIYSPLMDEQGKSCCNDRDCRPTHHRVTPSGVQMLVDGHWIQVPNAKVQYRALLGDANETGAAIGAAFSIKQTTTAIQLATM